MQKILQVIADGNPGGGTTHVIQLLSGLQKDYKLGLLTQYNSYLYKKAKNLKNVECYHLDFSNPLNFFPTTGFKKICEEFEPDLVHIHGLRAGINCYWGLNNFKYVYTVHGYHFLQNNKINFLVKKYFEKFIAAGSNRMMFVSQADKKYAIKSHIISSKTKNSVIYYGIKLSKKIKIIKGHKNIAFIARLVEQKDPYLFLDVVEKLQGYKVTMIGGGKLYKEIKELSKKRNLKIRFKGYLSHDDVLKVLPSFSCVVMTSKWEGLPILPLEAMWRGVPVVAVNVGGLSEIITNKITGILINSRSPGVIASEIRRLDGNPKLRKTIIGNAKKRVRKEFNEKIMIGKIDKIYHQTLQLK